MALHAVDTASPSRGSRTRCFCTLDDAPLHVVRRARTTVITVIAIATIGFTSLALFAFGANLLYLTWRATRLPPRTHRQLNRGTEPRVCVQVPIYNERYVAERVLDA